MASVSLKELLIGRAEFKDLTPDVQSNLMDGLEKLNKLAIKYPGPWKINDGYRRPQDSPSGGAAKSKHLEGLAVDIDDDAKGTVWFWLMKDEQMKLLKELGLYLEHGGYTHHKSGTWVHIQWKAPASGNRIFIPNSSPNPNPKFWNG